MLKYFRIFGSKWYIKKKDDIGKFDPRSDEVIFLGYSTKSKANRCNNKKLRTSQKKSSVLADKKEKSQPKIKANIKARQATKQKARTSKNL